MIYNRASEGTKEHAQDVLESSAYGKEHIWETEGNQSIYLASSKGEDGVAKIEVYTFPLCFPKYVPTL